MEVGSATAGSAVRQQNDTASQLKQLEKEQRAVDMQLKQLKANWKNTDANQKLKQQLQNKLKALSDQIEQLQTQGTQGTQATTEAKDVKDAEKAETTEKQRFDVYEKSPEKAPSDFSGVYNIKEDEEGRPQIQIDAPKQKNKAEPDLSIFFEKRMN